MSFIRSILLLGLAVYLHAGQAGAKEYHAGTLVIRQAWAPAGLGKQKIGAAYFTITNQGEAPDRLLSIELPGGGTAMLHESLMHDGIMRMRPVEAPEIPAGGELLLQPGGLHVMLSNLPERLSEGERIRLKLHFALAGDTEIEAVIKPRTTTPGPGSSHQDHSKGD